MRLRVLSDLHVELEDVALPDADADVVLLAGDIHIGLKGIAFAQRAFPRQRVLYVAGNHEYYGAALPHLTEKLRRTAQGTNVTFLEQDVHVVDDVRFLGCTLWTDFQAFGPDAMSQAMEIARSGMNDFRRIRKSPQFSRFSPNDARLEHYRARAWLCTQLEAPFAGRTVVVTHHAPTRLSNQARSAGNLLSAAYVSNLDDMMNGAHAQLWVHGHTHHCVDFEVNGTRILSNQRGYPSEPVPGFRSDLVVEV
jgi:predicted phosphodiesterase